MEINDQIFKSLPFSPVCSLCEHLQESSVLEGQPKCKAFPKEIPKDIWQGKNNHTTPYPNDQGIQFKHRSQAS